MPSHNGFWRTLGFPSDPVGLAARGTARVPERFRTVGIVIGRVTVMASSIVAVRIYTELLVPLEVGRMNLVLSIFQWFGMIFVSPVGLFVMRHSNSWDVDGTLRQNLRRLTIYLSLVACVAGVAVAGWQTAVGWGIGMSRTWLAWLVGGQLFLMVISGTNAGVLNNLGRSWWFVALGNVAAWLGLGFATILCLRYARQAEYWLTGLLCGQAVAWAMSLRVLAKASGARDRREPDLKPNTPFALRPLWEFASPIVPITLAYWCQTDGFRFVLQWHVGTSQLGVFLVGIALGGAPVLAVERLLVDLLSPAYYRQLASKDLTTMKVAWEEYVRRLLPAALICVTFSASSGLLLSRFLLSQKYQSVAVYAAYGALFRGCFVAIGPFLLWTHAIERTRSPMIAYFVGAAVALIGVAAIGNLSGMHGAGVALVVSAACTLALIAFQMRRSYSLAIPWRALMRASLFACPLLVGAPLLGARARSASLGWAIVALAVPVVYCLAGAAVFAEVVPIRRDILRWIDRFRQA